MRINWAKAGNAVRSSYWFIPSLMTAAAAALALTLLAIDDAIGTDWSTAYPWIFGNRPEGARQVLSTIAGSMITVAGVVFSLAIAAVSYAASQYGPRLLNNFMRDRANQIAFGTFVATFIYCLLVVRTIRGGDNDVNFVPHLSVLAGIALALASTGVLLFFVHHLPRSITLDWVVARIGGELLAQIRACRERAPADPPPDGPGAVACAARTGYVQAIDLTLLAEAVRRDGSYVRLMILPGAFVRRGDSVAEVWGGAIDTVADAVGIGAQRTPMQDPLFLIDELVEIAVRALSPGINDPFTASSCFDWLSAAVGEIGGAPLRPLALADAAHRIAAAEIAPAEVIFRAFGRFDDYLKPEDRIATRHFVQTLQDLTHRLEPPERAQLLRVTRYYSM